MRIPMRRTIPLTVMISFLLAYPACDEDSTPTGPGGGGVETVTLAFSITRYGSPQYRPFEYHITAAGIDTTIVTNTLSGVPA